MLNIEGVAYICIYANMLNMLNIEGVAYICIYANMLNMLNMERGCIYMHICKYAKYGKGLHIYAYMQIC